MDKSYCNEHKKSYVQYCMICEKYFCYRCPPHDDHGTISVFNFLSNDKILKEIKSLTDIKDFINSQLTSTSLKSEDFVKEVEKERLELRVWRDRVITKVKEYYKKKMSEIDDQVENGLGALEEVYREYVKMKESIEFKENGLKITDERLKKKFDEYLLEAYFRIEEYKELDLDTAIKKYKESIMELTKQVKSIKFHSTIKEKLNLKDLLTYKDNTQKFKDKLISLGELMRDLKHTSERKKCLVSCEVNAKTTRIKERLRDEINVYSNDIKELKKEKQDLQDQIKKLQNNEDYVLRQIAEQKRQKEKVKMAKSTTDSRPFERINNEGLAFVNDTKEYIKKSLNNCAQELQKIGEEVDKVKEEYEEKMNRLHENKADTSNIVEDEKEIKKLIISSQSMIKYAHDEIDAEGKRELLCSDIDENKKKLIEKINKIRNDMKIHKEFVIGKEDEECKLLENVLQNLIEIEQKIDGKRKEMKSLKKMLEDRRVTTEDKLASYQKSFDRLIEDIDNKKKDLYKAYDDYIKEKGLHKKESENSVLLTCGHKISFSCIRGQRELNILKKNPKFICKDCKGLQQDIGKDVC